jgi:hypothetical protein
MRVSGHLDADTPLKRITVDFWGADTFFDDHLIGPFDNPGPISPVGAVGFATYEADFCLPFSTLDEDDGEDEVYAKVSFAFSGRSFTLRTNEVSESF